MDKSPKSSSSHGRYSENQLTKGHVYIDFETRSEVDLRKAGVYRYAEDPSTEVLCMAYKLNDRPTKLWKRGEDWPVALDVPIGHGWTIHAHNAQFERLIWGMMTKREYWPQVPLEVWSCTAARAAAYGLPRSLDGATKALGLDVLKDDGGHRLMLQMCKPRRPSKTNPAKWFDDAERLERLYAYCIQDVEAEYALAQAIPELSEDELEVWRLDQRINDRGVQLDVETIEAALRLLGKLDKKAKKEITELTGGAVTSPGQVAKLLEWLKDLGVYAEDLQAETVDRLLKELCEVETWRTFNAWRALNIRREHSKSSTKKFKAMSTVACKDGRARGLLLYHGAHTGRWAGRLVQPQNMPRASVKAGAQTEYAIELVREGAINDLEMLYGPVTSTLSALLRPQIVAATGRTLLVADYSSIEARVLLWLARDKDGLDVFRRGDDIYKEMAGTIYGKDPATVTKAERALGKTAILGLGYGMGWKKFRATCESQGIEIDDKEAERVVKAYRKKYWMVKKLWNTIETAFIHIAERGHNFYKLPSGRLLHYQNLRYEHTDILSYTAENSQTKKWERVETWGGKLVENIVQAIARDVMADAMRRLEFFCPIVLTVHDEIICESDTPESLGNVETVMCTPPAWASDLPIAVEGWSGTRYRK